MLIAQGLPLPQLRPDRKSAAATCTSNTERTPTSSKTRRSLSTGNLTDKAEEASQKVPKLKLRRQRPSDTETDSSGTSCDTPQPLYEILPADLTDHNILSAHSEYSQDTCISTANENTDSLTSIRGLLSDTLPTCTQDAEQTCVRRLTLKIGGELVNVVNVNEQKI